MGQEELNVTWVVTSDDLQDDSNKFGFRKLYLRIWQELAEHHEAHTSLAELLYEKLLRRISPMSHGQQQF